MSDPKAPQFEPETAIYTPQQVATYGLAAVPSGNMERIDGVTALMNQVGKEAARERMTAAWEGWKTSKTKDGRPYSRTNLAWIDHAITGEVPQGSAPTNAANSVQTNADGSLYV